jgi:beta-glucanase (GH16 family)
LPSQVSLSGGYLNITATAQSATCSGTTKSYSSGAVVWSSFNFTYGTVEYRAKMPGGQGPWPAVWMLGKNCQPPNATTYNASGCNWKSAGSEELDMTEYLSGNFTSDLENIWSNLVSSPACSASLSDASQNFHVYDTVWAAGSMKWYIDGNQVCSQTWTGSALSSPMYLIINIAMGGAGGSITNSTLPQTMQVDYVKVTQP